MEQNDVYIKSEKLEILILNYMFSNMKRDYYASNGFALLEGSNNNKNLSIKLDYKVIKEDGTFNKKLKKSLVPKDVYSREECKALADELYLKDENTIAFILKILNPDVRFK